MTNLEVLRTAPSIGPVETSHFQTWHDKAGNAVNLTDSMGNPISLTDPTNGLFFPNLNFPPFGGEDFQTNLIMPEPCNFLSSKKFPVCSIIRPTETRGAAMGRSQVLRLTGSSSASRQSFSRSCAIWRKTPMRPHADFEGRKSEFSPALLAGAVYES